MIAVRYEISASPRFLQFLCSVFVLWPFALCAPTAAAAISLSGNVTDPQGSVVAGATVRLLRHRSEWLGKITEAGVHRRAEFF
jgi:hypothetical protein